MKKWKEERRSDDKFIVYPPTPPPSAGAPAQASHIDWVPLARDLHVDVGGV